MIKFISYNERQVGEELQSEALPYFQIICMIVATIAPTIIAANIASTIPMSVTTENAAVNALFLSNFIVLPPIIT